MGELVSNTDLSVYKTELKVSSLEGGAKGKGGVRNGDDNYLFNTTPS